jgi:putative Ca2+/H+ antiporter (TMEM165/GDT1 family)
MFLKTFSSVFITVFLAEIGDKTQLATMLFAADKHVNNWHVFLASSCALVVAAAIGVFAGALLGKYISENTLRYAAGAGFIAIGLWTIIRT